MFNCDSMSDHARWYEGFHYWDTKLSCKGFTSSNELTLKEKNISTPSRDSPRLINRQLHPGLAEIPEIQSEYFIDTLWVPMFTSCV